MLFFILLVGFILRLSFINKPEGLWNDEYVSWYVANTPFREGFWQEVLKQCHMPLYYLLLKPFASCSDIVLRLTSVVVGVLAIFAMYFAGKEFLTTPRRKEVERCRLAFETAAKGKQVAMICSGDAGVYGMAGLMYELSKEWPDIEIKVIPGVTAATGGAAVLGAPLIHDFALISLSDLLTPWEKIEKRILLASEADFVICIYNPGSHKRADYLEKACDLMLRYKTPETVCGIVSQIGRDGETSRTLTLAELRNTKVDMFTTVFVGNSQTKEIQNHMVTPRGYRYE